MCGFILSINDDRVDIEYLINSIKHRGPDSTKLYRKNNYIAGFNRLSIVDDRDIANQPMVDEDEEYLLLFNGEIYNHNYLRSELKNKYNIDFKSNSDSEVLLRGMICEGKKFIPKIDGIFAFVFVHIPDQTTIIARDQFGVKPVYYTRQNEKLYISSEIKPLQKVAKSSILPHGVVEYLTIGYSAGENTLFNNVYKVEPNTILTIKSDAEIQKEPIYSFIIDSLIETDKAEIQSRLISAIHGQKSDIPFGILFSGGIDSTIILSNCYKDVHYAGSYSVNVEHAEMSERKYQDYVLEKLNIMNNHHNVSIYKKDFSIANIQKLAENLDMPLFHPNFVGALKITEHARKNGIKVLISGEGADELFFGYRWFYDNSDYSDFLEYIPLKYMKNIFGVDNIDLSNYYNMERQEVFQKVYLQRWLLRQDLTGMANSVEVRVPFLGNKFANYINTINRSFLKGNLDSKWVLKDMLKSQYSDEFIFRKKIGFDFPLNEWISEEHYNYVIQQNQYYDNKLLIKNLKEMEGSYMRNRMIFSLFSYLAWVNSI